MSSRQSLQHVASRKLLAQITSPPNSNTFTPLAVPPQVALTQDTVSPVPTLEFPFGTSCNPLDASGTTTCSGLFRVPTYTVSIAVVCIGGGGNGVRFSRRRGGVATDASQARCGTINGTNTTDPNCTDTYGGGGGGALTFANLNSGNDFPFVTDSSAPYYFNGATLLAGKLHPL